MLKCFDILLHNHISVYYLPALLKEVNILLKKRYSSTVNTKVNELEGIFLPYFARKRKNETFLFHINPKQ